MHGRDLHIGDFRRGVLPPAAPLAISALNVAGLAFAMAQEGRGRVAVAMIGEGGTSLGEWHEAINTCAAARLPAIFCVQNNRHRAVHPGGARTAPPGSSPTRPRATASPASPSTAPIPKRSPPPSPGPPNGPSAGEGPTLIELVCLRICGHAHHDDMLYLGKEQPPGWDYPELLPERLRQCRGLRLLVAARSAGPLRRTARSRRRDRQRRFRGVEKRSRGDGGGRGAGGDRGSALARSRPRSADGVYRGVPAEARRDVLADAAGRRSAGRAAAARRRAALPIRAAAPSSKRSCSACATRCAPTSGSSSTAKTSAATYGNAFLLLRPLLEEFPGRLLNSTLSEAATLGVCGGRGARRAAAGRRDPVQRLRGHRLQPAGQQRGQAALPLGLLRRRQRADGGAHAVGRPAFGRALPQPEHRALVLPGARPQDRGAVDPEDARALLLAAVADPDPVLFYEHIALYRDPQDQAAAGRPGAGAPAPGTAALGKAALRARRQRPRDRLLRRLRAPSRCAPPRSLPPRASTARCSTCARWRRSTARPCCGWRCTAGGC